MRHRIRWLVALPVAAVALAAAGLFAAWRIHFGATERPLPPAFTAAVPSPVADALAALRAGQSRLAAGWRYRERIAFGSGSELLAYDPVRPAGSRWRVLAVNGKAPKAADRRRLDAQAEAGVKAASALPAASDWLARSAYRLVATTPATLVYQLRPRVTRTDPDAARALLPHLSGRLVIARSDHHPLSLRLENFESFSPRFGVTVEDFAFHADFRSLGTGGPLVAVRIGTEARGKILWFKHFADRTGVVLSDFGRAASSATAPAAATAH